LISNDEFFVHVDSQPEEKQKMYRRLLLLTLVSVQFAYTQAALADPTLGSGRKIPLLKAGVTKPIVLRKGPQLFLDDHLVAYSKGVERKVVQPERFLKEPVVTSVGDHLNWQPWFSVLHDPTLPAEKRFRIWYNADINPDPADYGFTSKLSYMESADGIHWPSPPQRLDTVKSILWGTSVIDDGPKHPVPTERYKLIYWFYDGSNIGPVVAFSPDGLTWTMHNDGKPLFNNIEALDDSWHAGYDPLRKRYFLMGKDHGNHYWNNAEGKNILRSVRMFGTSNSKDFKTWQPLRMIFTQGPEDPGITEFYAVTGFHVRGDLMIGFIQILRDDLRPEGAPDEAVFQNMGNAGSGMGYTVLTWTRDGENWYRDYQPNNFFEPNPEVGSWDHAMGWVSSAAPVGDELYLYYAGYRWGHKLKRSGDRQIGLVKMKQDRYVARQAGEQGGTIITPLVKLTADRLTLNTDAAKGEVRVQVTDELGQPISGFKLGDCKPVAVDALDAPVEWQGGSLTALKGQSVRLEFSLKNARLFAFNIEEPQN
jgi:hypothetical protein